MCWRTQYEIVDEVGDKRMGWRKDDVLNGMSHRWEEGGQGDP